MAGIVLACTDGILIAFWLSTMLLMFWIGWLYKDLTHDMDREDETKNLCDYCGGVCIDDYI